MRERERENRKNLEQGMRSKKMNDKRKKEGEKKVREKKAGEQKYEEKVRRGRIRKWVKGRSKEPNIETPATTNDDLVFITA